MLYNALRNCELSQGVSYCGSGAPAATLEYQCSVSGWNYYLSRLGFMYSDTLAGNNGKLVWNKVNGNLLPGEYILHASNSCKSVNVDTFTIAPPALPADVTIHIVVEMALRVVPVGVNELRR